MRRPLTALAALGAAAAFAGAGFAAGSGGGTDASLGGFGGPVGVHHPRPLWREDASSPGGTLHRVRCATAAVGDTSACFAP